MVKFKNTCKSSESPFIAIWKKHVSIKQLIQFIPNKKTGLYEILKETHEGVICLKYFKKIKCMHKKRNHEMFINTVEQVGKHLERYPMLIAFFPLPLLQNIKRIRKAYKSSFKNAICLTKYHKLNCALCNETIIGNKSKYLFCNCATRFYHADCYKQINERCEVCLYNYRK